MSKKLLKNEIKNKNLFVEYILINFIKINVFIVNLFNKNTFLINLLVGSLN